MKAEQFDQKFDANEDDILDDLDLSKISRPNQTKKRVNVDFHFWAIDLLDKEASCVGVTRRSIIKVWLVERLKQQAANRVAQTDIKQLAVLMLRKYSQPFYAA